MTLYSLNWNTTQATNSTHTITATALDAAGLSSSTNIVLTVNNSPVAPPIPILITAYSFNEGSGVQTADITGNNHLATLTNTAWTTGKYGNAVLLNGTTSFISAADASNLDFTTGLTLEAWVYPATITGYQAVIVKQFVYWLYACDGNGKVQGGMKIGGVNRIVTSSSSLPANVWSHLALTYDGSVLRLYVNGAQTNNLTATGLIDTSTGSLFLGAQSGDDFFNGRLDDVRVYNNTLTQAAIQSDMNTPLGSLPDTTAPVVSGVASSSITSSSARINWTTNEPSDTQVEYGTTISYGNTTTLNPSLVTAHQVDLVGLVSSSTYHFRVKSRDVANNLTTSGDFTFATSAPADVTPPVISNIAVTNISVGSATVGFTTNEPADTSVEYGLTTSYGSFTIPDFTLVLPHSTGLFGLLSNTLYHFRIKSRDGSGNLATSPDQNFSTLAASDGTPPIISNVSNTNPTSSGTSINWTTNEPSTSQVEYGTTTSYGNNTSLDSSLVLSHAVSVAGLLPSTIYHYRVKSVDAAGNGAVSGDFTFVTAMAADTTPPTISNGMPIGALAVGTISATLSVSTNEAATCRYSTTPGVLYASMVNTFSTTGGLTHSTVVTGLVNGQTYTYYVKARDAAGNVKTSDYIITFSVSSPPQPPPYATITVTAPAGGENWKIGSSKQIRWVSNGVTTNVKVELLKDSAVYLLFNNLANSGSVLWTVTAPRNNNCKIRISSIGGPAIGLSNLFKIT